jgi:uncharacterized SAM-binding protein YcdF (DUF218 family)
MFIIKKLVGGLLMPLPFLGLLALFSLLSALKGRKAAAFFAFLWLFSLLAISTPFFANVIIKDNEPTSLAFNQIHHPHVDKIVVLGCGINPNSSVSSNSQLGGCALSRLVEGIRLSHLYPNAELVLSGGGFGAITNSSLMYQTALDLGIDKRRLKQNPQAMDTAQEALFLASSLVDLKVVLVTSVSHMPRAKKLFNAQGVDVITAATDYHNFAVLPGYKQFIPNAGALNVITEYTHEFIGNKWIELRLWFNSQAL